MLGFPGACNLHAPHSAKMCDVMSKSTAVACKQPPNFAALSPCAHGKHLSRSLHHLAALATRHSHASPCPMVAPWRWCCQSLVLQANQNGCVTKEGGSCDGETQNASGCTRTQGRTSHQVRLGAVRLTISYVVSYVLYNSSLAVQKRQVRTPS